MLCIQWVLPSLSHLSILDILVSISKLSKAASDSKGGSMAIWVVKFLRGEYKIWKIFEQKSGYSIVKKAQKSDDLHFQNDANFLITRHYVYSQNIIFPWSMLILGQKSIYRHFLIYAGNVGTHKKTRKAKTV